MVLKLKISKALNSAPPTYSSLTQLKVCEREGGHIAGSRPKPHLRKENPHAADGKKECNTCKSVLSIDSFSYGKSICKACRAARYKEKYAGKKASF